MSVKNENAAGGESVVLERPAAGGVYASLFKKINLNPVSELSALDTGARNVDSLLNQQILPVLSQQLLSHMAAKQKPHSLTLSWDEEDGIGLEFSGASES